MSEEVSFGRIYEGCIVLKKEQDGQEASFIFGPFCFFFVED